MIFAADTNERSLHVFPDPDTATAYCDGRDVESTLWLFWDDNGAPLQPEFSILNRRGLLITSTGVYHLVPASGALHGVLSEALEQIRQVVGAAPLTSVCAVRHYLAERYLG